jgi:hypothetical protein
MDLELPERLHGTRDLLMRSLVLHSEQAPAMPAGLAADLDARFADHPAPVTSPVSWLEKVRAFLAAPGFGAVAAAVVVLGVAIPMLSGPSPETIRGAEAALPADSVRIQLVGSNPQALAAIQASGMFDAAAISSVDTLSAAGISEGPKVIVDFSTASITAVDRDGQIVHREELPAETSMMAAVIADAVSRL